MKKPLSEISEEDKREAGLILGFKYKPVENVEVLIEYVFIKEKQSPFNLHPLNVIAFAQFLESKGYDIPNPYKGEPQQEQAAWKFLLSHLKNTGREFYYIAHTDICKEIALVMEAYKQQQETGIEPLKWISVEDRLPEEGGRYWCYVRDVNDCLGVSYFQWNCSYHEVEKVFRDSCLTNGEQVIYWMPLPNPPKANQ